MCCHIDHSRLFCIRIDPFWAHREYFVICIRSTYIFEMAKLSEIDPFEVMYDKIFYDKIKANQIKLD